MMAKKHLLTFGHDPNKEVGAVHGKLTEATEIRKLKPYLEKWAKKSKDTFDFYEGDLFADRAMRHQKGYDTVTELHLDAPSGNGGHVIIYKDYKPDNIDKRLRDVIEDHFGIVGYLQSANGFSYRNNLYNINQAAQHSINYRLLELFFLSNAEDYNYYLANLDAVAKDLVQAITGETLDGSVNVSKPVKPSVTKVKPTPKAPSTSGARLVKNEKATYTVTTSAGIKVRNAPSTSATHTGTLKQGQAINYDSVYEGNGYRWLSYIGNSGNRLYVPYRPSNDIKSQWGTFGNTPAKPKPKTTSVAGAKLVKHETANFTVTNGIGIKVRNAPSTKATHTGTLQNGTTIRYDRVYEGNGYRWLSYIGGSGNRLYVPYRPINNKSNQWGRFH